MFTYILHTAIYIFTGLLIFGLLRAQLLLYPKVFFLCLLHFGEGCIICKTTAFQLLARGLTHRQSMMLNMKTKST